MRKKIVILALLLQAGGFSAQNEDPKGQHCVTVGYGVPNLYKVILKNAFDKTHLLSMVFGSSGGSTYTTKAFGSGPFFLKYDHMVRNHIGLGVVIGYFNAGIEETHKYTESSATSPAVNYTDVTRLDFSSLSIGGRFNYHFGKNPKFDPYLGFATGYNSISNSFSFKSDNPNLFSGRIPLPAVTSNLYLALTFGWRYYINEHLGFYAEIGLDKWAIIQGGLAFKFK